MRSLYACGLRLVTSQFSCGDCTYLQSSGYVKKIRSRSNQFITFRTKKPRKKMQTSYFGKQLPHCQHYFSFRHKPPGDDAYAQRKAYFKYPPAGNLAFHYHLIKKLYTDFARSHPHVARRTRTSTSFSFTVWQ